MCGLGMHRIWGDGVGSWLLGVDARGVYGFEGFGFCLWSTDGCEHLIIGVGLGMYCITLAASVPCRYLGYVVGDVIQR